MPTVLKLALDAEEYKRELERVIAETRAAAQTLGAEQAQLKVTAAAEQAEEAISEIKGTEIPDKTVRIHAESGEVIRQLEQTGRAANAAGVNAARSFSKAGSAVSAISGALGGIDPKISMIGQSLSALAGGPIAIAAAGIGLLIAALAKVYDTLTVSSQKLAAQNEALSEKLSEGRRKLSEYDQAAGQMVSQLKELNAADQTGLGAKRATADILSTLKNRYGDLGARIDETTGKVLNLAEVEARLNRQRAEKKAGLLYSEASLSGSQAEAAYMKIKGSEWFTTEVGAQRQFRTMRKVMSPDNLIAEMEARSRSATSEDEIRGYAEVAKLLRTEKQQREKAAEIRGSGYDSKEDAASAAAQKVQEAQAARKALRETERANHVAEMDREYQREQNAERKAQNRLQLAREESDLRDKALEKERNLRGELSAVNSSWSMSPQAKEEKRAELERQIAAAAKEAAEADGRRAGYWAQYSEALYSSTNEYTRLRREAKQQIEYDQLLIEGKYKEAAALKLKNDFLQKGRTLTQEQLSKLLDLQQAAQGQESRKRIQDAEEELRIRRLILAGKYKEAETAKLEAEARKAGRALSSEEKERRLAATETGNRLKLQKTLSDQAESLYGQAMQAAGRAREYGERKAIRDAEVQKGRELTGEEKRNVRRLFSLTEQLNNMKANPEIRGLSEIRTNELTARGGFSGAVRLPDTESYNREISQSSKEQATLLREIKGLCEKLGRF